MDKALGIAVHLLTAETLRARIYLSPNTAQINCYKTFTTPLHSKCAQFTQIFSHHFTSISNAS